MATESQKGFVMLLAETMEWPEAFATAVMFIAGAFVFYVMMKHG